MVCFSLYRWRQLTSAGMLALCIAGTSVGIGLSKASAATPCDNGSAAGFVCDDIDFLSHVNLPDIGSGPVSGADVWGFVDLNSNREYAIIGVSNGTAFFDITDPENPMAVGFVQGSSTIWRDIKVYQYYDDALSRWQAYAYITSDGGSTGQFISDPLFIVDLTGLPHSIQKLNFASDFSSAHNVFASNTDYTTGLSLTGEAPQLIIAGSDLGAGQFRIYSLNDPISPSFVGTAPAAGNMHDTTTFFVTDQRKDSQCVNAGNADACEILVDFNGTSVDIWDITNASNPALLSKSQYPNRQYAHSGWQTEDGQFLFIQDELDEGTGPNTTLNVFDLAVLTSPLHVGSWVGLTGAIDHNGFVRGNRYYMTNYTRGLTILDINDPTKPVDAGIFDTYGTNDLTAFEGAWGVYPFFNSGTIAVSDINTGLYLLKDMTRNVPRGSLAFSTQSFAAEEGQQTSIVVQRLGGGMGPVSVDFQILPATADSSDYQTMTGTLNWPDGDNSDKSIVIDLTADVAAEGLERIILRLINPSGGATLADLNTTSLYLSDPGAQSEIGFLDTIVESSEAGLTTVILVVQRSGSAIGQVSIDYAISGGDASIGLDFSGDTSGTLVWADGDAVPKSLIISIIEDADAEATEFFTLTLSNPQGAIVTAAGTAQVNITSVQPPPPIPPALPPPRSGGNGAPAPAILLILGLWLVNRWRRKETIGQRIGHGGQISRKD